MERDERVIQQQNTEILQLGRTVSEQAARVKAYQAVIEGWRPVKVFAVGARVRFGPGQRLVGTVRTVLIEGQSVRYLVGYWTPAQVYHVSSFPQEEVASDDTMVPVEVVE